MVKKNYLTWIGMDDWFVPPLLSLELDMPVFHSHPCSVVLFYMYIRRSLKHLFCWLYSSLGAKHDADGNSCQLADEYIMAEKTAVFDKTEAYSINPWKFSSCSVNYFRTFLSTMRYSTINIKNKNRLDNDIHQYQKQIQTRQRQHNQYQKQIQTRERQPSIYKTNTDSTTTAQSISKTNTDSTTTAINI